jgi:hypothetical protein
MKIAACYTLSRHPKAPAFGWCRRERAGVRACGVPRPQRACSPSSHPDRHARLLLPVALALLAGAATAQTPAPASAAAAAPAEPPRHALVIGHSRYAEVSALPNAANDLADMCAALTRLRFKATCLADLPDRQAFMQAVHSFIAGVPRGASAVLYYGGHAIQVAGENYLIPTRASAADARGWLPQFVRLSELFQATERANAGFQFIVLDACRDDPEGATTTAAAAAATPAARSGREGLRSMLAGVRGAAGVASYGIAAVRDAPRNTLVLFATGAGTAAFDGDGERNGPLTKQVLQQIGKPQQSIDQLVKTVIQQVGDDTERRYRRRQSPTLYGTFAGEFCFNGCPQLVSSEALEEERRRSAERERVERERREQERRQRREGAVVPTL